MSSDKKILDIHENFLKKQVFFTFSKWPQYDLLFNDIKYLAKKLKKNHKALLLERTNLYGGISLFAPFFKKNTITSVDCVSKTLLKRGSYNSKNLQSNKIIKIKSNYQFDYRKIKLKKGQFDLIIIPNLMHHISDPEKIIHQSYRLLKKNGTIYIFEPLFREVHQYPEDYFRFTPYGLRFLLKKINFKNEKYKTIGGPFTSAMYFWDQAIQYLKGPLKTKRQRWFKDEFKKLVILEKKFKKNLIRKNTFSPTAFSITAKK